MLAIYDTRYGPFKRECSFPSHGGKCSPLVAAIATGIAPSISLLAAIATGIAPSRSLLLILLENNFVRYDLADGCAKSFYSRPQGNMQRCCKAADSNMSRLFYC